ncbi:hypothetical protein D918_04069 [Trichuris suis]|nr:hypothetical protein D918_04069 [Trichuris suis]
MMGKRSEFSFYRRKHRMKVVVQSVAQKLPCCLVHRNSVAEQECIDCLYFLPVQVPVTTLIHCKERADIKAQRCGVHTERTCGSPLDFIVAHGNMVFMFRLSLFR